MPSEGEEANRICEEIAIFNHKNPNFFNKNPNSLNENPDLLSAVPAEFIKRIAEILGKMKI